MTIATTENQTVEIERPAAMLPTAPNAVRLVQWAEEAQAANHLARALCRTPFAGSWKGDEDGATAAILKGAEVGLTPVTAMGAFDNIQGTPAPKAMTLRALVQAHGHDLEIIEETAERAVARYRRNGQGDWIVTDFTIEDAKQMNLLGKDNWKKQPRAMLVARVTSKAARLVASDVILGIGYSAEEVRDETVWDGRTTSPRESMSGRQRLAGVLGTGPTAPEVQPDVTAIEVPLIAESDDEMLDVTSGLAKAMFASVHENGVAEVDRIAWLSNVIGRDVASSKEMTAGEARQVLRFIEGNS